MMTFHPARTLRNLLILGLVATASHALGGTEWNRAADYLPGSEVPGSTDAVAMSWLENKEVWSYYYGKSANENWYSQDLKPLVWDEQWYAEPNGVWSVSDNNSPMVRREMLHFGLVKEVMWKAGVIRWRNPEENAIRVDLKGTLKPSWHPFSSAKPPSSYPDVELVVALMDEAGEPKEELLKVELSYEKDNDKGVPMEVKSLDVPAGYSIVFALRSLGAADAMSWINLDDQITIEKL